jgi:hypothetical protein
VEEGRRGLPSSSQGYEACCLDDSPAQYVSSAFFISRLGPMRGYPIVEVVMDELMGAMGSGGCIEARSWRGQKGRARAG